MDEATSTMSWMIWAAHPKAVPGATPKAVAAPVKRPACSGSPSREASPAHTSAPGSPGSLSASTLQLPGDNFNPQNTKRRRTVSRSSSPLPSLLATAASPMTAPTRQRRASLWRRGADLLLTTIYTRFQHASTSSATATRSSRPSKPPTTIGFSQCYS